MTYHGHIENGHIILDDSVALPEGARISVEIEPTSKKGGRTQRVRDLFGAVQSGDSRFADNDRIDADLVRAYGDGG